MPILDQHGRAIPATPAKRPANLSAIAQIPNPAQRFNSGLHGKVRPEVIARVLRAAADGDAEAYLGLAEDMEEKYGHYKSVLSTRKLAVAGESIEVTPGNKSKRAKLIAEAFREKVVETDQFEAMLFDMMDALGKGYSVIEPVWDTTTRPWTYRAFTWHDPRFFTFDKATRKEIRVLSPSDPENGAPLPAGFVTHYPRLKTGIPIRGGLARVAAVAYCFTTFTLADWAAFCEVYGMPLRYAHYDPQTTTEPELELLRTALANIGHDAAALLPHGMNIEFVDARRPAANGKNVFEGLANYWDGNVSKVVLGQTMTTDDGSSKAQGEVHERVQTKYAIADSKTLCATIKRGIAVPWVLYNYGEKDAIENLPKLRQDVELPEDLVAFTNGLLPWVRDTGLKVGARQIRERFSMDEPDEDDEILEVAQEDPADQNPDMDPNPKARQSEKKPKKKAGGT